MKHGNLLVSFMIGQRSEKRKPYRPVFLLCEDVLFLFLMLRHKVADSLELALSRVLKQGVLNVMTSFTRHLTGNHLVRLPIPCSPACLRRSP